MQAISFSEMGESKAVEIMAELTAAFGEADMHRETVGYRVSTRFWDPAAPGAPRHFPYIGSETTVGSSAEARDLVDRLEAGEILRFDEANEMRGRLGL